MGEHGPNDGPGLRMLNGWAVDPDTNPWTAHLQRPDESPEEHAERLERLREQRRSKEPPASYSVSWFGIKTYERTGRYAHRRPGLLESLIGGTDNPPPKKRRPRR